MIPVKVTAAAIFLGLPGLVVTDPGSGPFAGEVVQDVSVTRVRPEIVYAERRGSNLRLNFDVELLNRRDTPVEITYLELRVFAPDGRFLTRAHIGSNGLPGPLATIPDRVIEPGTTLYLFNPFPDLPVDETAGRALLRIFHTAGHEEVDIPLHRPPGPTVERPPVDEKGYVFSGSDAHSHHRRVALDSSAAVNLGLEHVAQRFSLDLTVVDPRTGDLANSEAGTVEDYYAIGSRIVAPADGRVVKVRNDMPDNALTSSGAIVKPKGYEEAGDDASLGNHVILDIGSAYLVMAHLRRNSIRVDAGDSVSAGDLIGEIGLSGDTAYPHLHIQLQDSPDALAAQPLPIIFECIRVGSDENGAEQHFVSVDTGMFVRPCDD